MLLTAHILVLGHKTLKKWWRAPASFRVRDDFMKQFRIKERNEMGSGAVLCRVVPLLARSRTSGIEKLFFFLGFSFSRL